MKVYLSGPMSGIPQFNIPEFERVTGRLRAMGWEVLSPHELDGVVLNDASKSADGDIDAFEKKTGVTWGDLLARDVKLIADEGVEGVVNLAGWEKSRGARLENYVALLCKLPIYAWRDAYGGPVPIADEHVAELVVEEWIHAIYTNGT